MRTSWKITLTLLAGIGAPVLAAAQTYTASQFSQTFVPIGAGTTITFPSNDDGAASIPIGFTWSFFGQTYTRLNVAVNGHLWPEEACPTGICRDFGDSCVAGTCEATSGSTGAFLGPVFGGGNFRPALIAPFWDDLFVRGANPSAQVLYAVTGVAPTRTLTVEWRNIRNFSTADTLYANLQVRIQESGGVELAWGPVVGAAAGTWNGNIGVQSPDLTQGFVPNVVCANSETNPCDLSVLASLTNQVFSVALVDGPELVAGVSAPPGGDPGQAIQVVARARNLGTRSTTTSFAADVYFSVDDTIDPAVDTFLGRVTLPIVGPAATVTATLSTNVPAMLLPGSYRIGVIVDADRVVPQTARGNDVAVSGPFLIGPEVNATLVAPTRTGPGEILRADATIQSDGSPVIMTDYALYLSADATLDAQDLRIGTGTIAIGGLASVVASVRGTVTTTITPGPYRLILRLDPNDVIAEIDETNNVAVAQQPVTVVGPDLRTSEVSGPLLAFRGRPYTARARIQNIGGARTADFFYSFYLSDNNLITVSDPELGAVGPLSLRPSESVSEPHTFVVPAALPAGNYYLGVIADSTSQLIEQDPRNNISRQTAAVVVRDPAPDFRVAEVIAQAQGAAGEPLALDHRIENVGVAPGTTPYTLYLSRDRAVDTADRVLGTGTVTVADGGEVSGYDAPVVPADVPAGVYFVLVAIDPAGTITQLDTTNDVGVSAGSVTLEAAALQVLTTALPPATVGVPFEVELAARGGSGAFSWSQTGALPPGLALDAMTGRISGTPTRAGQFPVVFTVSSGGLQVAWSATFFVTEASSDLAVITRSVPPGFVGQRFEVPLIAVGGAPPYEWTVRGAPPAGLRLDPSGVITGIPTAPVVVALTVRVRDLRGATAERPITLRVAASDDVLRFDDTALPDGVVNESYDATLSAMNGLGSYRFELADGRLPPGLMLTDTKLTGTPTVAGTYVFGLRVHDERNDSDLNRYVVVIEPSPGAVRFVSTGLPRAERGTPYEGSDGAIVRVTAVGQSVGRALDYTLILGALPPGLTLSLAGTVTGTPTQAGLYTFAAEARDPFGNVDRRALSIAVDEPPVVVPPPPPSGCQAVGGGGSIWLALVGGLWAWRGRRRRSGVLGALALLAVMPTSARAQMYVRDDRSVPFVTRAGGTSLTFSSTDDAEATVTLPFSFNYYGNGYSSVRVSTNGYVSFTDQAISLSNTAIPDRGTPNNVIVGFWDDLSIQSVTTYLEGNAPSRVFIIQWIVTRLGSTGPFQMQLWLYEGGAGRFEYRYSTAAANGTFAASLGFENATGTVGESWRTCSPNCSLTDLQALDNRALGATMDGGTEVVANGLTAPRRVFAGVPFEVRSTFSSVHQQPLGPFHYAIEQYDGATSTQLLRSSAVTLTPFQTVERVDVVSFPASLAPGSYRLRLVVDSDREIAEPDESNNVANAPDTVSVLRPTPDLTVASVSASPLSGLSSGSPITVRFTARNLGSRGASATYRVVLSQNRVPSTADAILGTTTASVGALASSTSTLALTIPSGVTPGRYYVGVLADPDAQLADLSRVNNSASSPDAIAIATNQIAILAGSIPAGLINQDYSFYFRASGGDGTYRWEVTSGTLPAGLILVPSSGELRGRVSQPASVPFSVRVTSAGQTVSRDFQLVIAEPMGPLNIVTRELLPGFLGRSYPPLEAEQTLENAPRLQVVNARGDVRFSPLAPVPDGLVLDADGLLRGTPTQPGAFDLGVQATDGTQTATRAVRFQVLQPGRLTLIASVLPDAALGEEYNYQLQVIGALPGAQLRYTPIDEPPPGLSLTDSGLITGIPTRLGRSRFAIAVRSGARLTDPADSALFTLAVGSSGTFGMTPTTLPPAEVGKLYDAMIEARGGTSPLEWSVSVVGSLPRGLRFAEEDGPMDRARLRFLGTPEEVPAAEQGGTVSFFVTLTDAEARTLSLPFAIRVSEPPPPPPPPVKKGCRCLDEGSTGGLGSLALAALLFIGRRRRGPRAS